MKLWITPRYLPSHTNCYRPTTSNTLHCRHLPSIHLCSPHLPKRAIWMTNPKPTRKRSLLLLYLHLPSHRPRTILRLIPKQRNLKRRSHPPTNSNSNCFRRVRPSLRTNIILRSYSHHKPILSNPIHRTNTSRMSLRRILSRQPNTNPILCPTLPTTIRNRRTNTSSPHLPTRNRIKQPPRNSLRL